MEILGNDVIHRHIFHYLDHTSKFNLRLVNRQLNNMHYLNVAEVHLNRVKLPTLKRYKNLKTISCPKTQIINRTVESFPSSLQKLNVSSCYRLNGNLDLSKFIQLENFKCCNTRLTNQVMNSVSSSLKKLKIEYCHCLDKDLDLSKFLNLEKLCMTSCSGIDISRMNLSKLVNLKVLHCSLSNISDQTTGMFPVSLETLVLDGNHPNSAHSAFDFSAYALLRVFICTAICFQGDLHKKLPYSLEKMDLVDCRGISDLDLSKFSKLRYLRCSTTLIENISASTLPLSIETLVLKNSEIVYAHLFNLSNLTNLKVLDCSGTNISTISIDTIPLLVEEVSLRNCPIINVGTFDLSEHIRLKKLDCFGIKNFTKTNISKLPPSLENLDISGCNRLGNIVLSRYSNLKVIKCFSLNIGQIAQYTFPLLLEELTLQGCKCLSPRKFDLTAYKSLEDLDCSFTNMTDEMMSWFPTCLKKLDISGCKKLKSITLSKYSKIKVLNCVKLNIRKVTSSTFPISIEKLNLEGCQYLDARNFNLSAFKNLIDLDISNTNLTYEALEKLPMSIKKLHIIGCTKLNKFDLSVYNNLEELSFDRNLLDEWTLTHFPMSLIKLYDYKDVIHRKFWPGLKNPPYVNFFI